MNRPDATPRTFSADTLSTAFTEVGGSARPGYLDDIVAQAARTRQRPAWTFIERWLPMSTFATAPPMAPVRPIPRASLARALAILVLTLMTAALIGATLLGTSPSPIPDAGVRNGLLAFDAERDIWFVNSDGTDLRRLTETPDSETSPVWSPDGTRLAVWRSVKAVTSVAIMNPDGSIERTITPPDGTTFLSATTPPEGRSVWIGGDTNRPFTPDGAWVVAEQVEAPGAETTVAMFGLDAGQRSLFPGGAATVSPDGGWVAFLRGGGGTGHSLAELHVAPIDGTSASRLVSDEVCGCTATWSPDGTRLATWTPPWDEVLIIDAFGDAAPIRVPSPGNVGVLSWQALR